MREGEQSSVNLHQTLLFRIEEASAGTRSGKEGETFLSPMEHTKRYGKGLPSLDDEGQKWTPNPALDKRMVREDIPEKVPPELGFVAVVVFLFLFIFLN